MKKLSLIILPLLILYACKTESGVSDLAPEMKILSTNFSGCNGLKSEMLSDENEKWIVSCNNDVYRVEHINANFNCCLPNGILIEVYQSSDTIFFNDSEKTLGTCRCICNYSTMCEVVSLKEGNYVLCFNTGGSCKGSINLKFESGMYEEITVLELADNY